LGAQILPARAAEGAPATGPAQPRNAYARAGGKPFRALTVLDDFTDNFVPRHEREFWPNQVAVENVQIGAAHPASAHADEKLPALRLRNRQIGFIEQPARFAENHRAHEEIGLRAVRFVKASGGSITSLENGLFP